MTISGPLKRIMIHRIYDNLFVKSVAKKNGSGTCESCWNWKGNFDPLPQMGQDSILRNEIVILYSFQFSFWMTYNDKGQGWKILLLLTVFKKLASSVSDVFQFSWNFQCFISFCFAESRQNMKTQCCLSCDITHKITPISFCLLTVVFPIFRSSLYSYLYLLHVWFLPFSVFLFCETFSNGTIFVSPYVQVYKKGSLLYSEAATAVSSCVCFMWKKVESSWELLNW